MTEHHFDLGLFGARVRARRKALGYSQTSVPGGPSSTYLSRLERGDLYPITPDLLDKLARGIQWDRSKLQDVLDERASVHDLPVEVAEPSTEGHTATTYFEALSEEADRAQRRFEQLSAELAVAEAEVDAANDRVFAFMALEDVVKQWVAERERALGRPLTTAELHGNPNLRASDYETAMGRVGFASNDPHERTRYEIALMIAVDKWEPEAAVAGSRFLDMRPAFDRVERVLAQADQLAERRNKMAAKRESSESDEILNPAADDFDSEVDEEPGGSDRS